MTTFRLAVIADGRRKQVETSLEDFSFWSVQIRGKYIKDIDGKLALQGPVKIGDGTANDEAASVGQVELIHQLVNGNTQELSELQESLDVVRLLAALNKGEIARVNGELEYLKANRSLEERIVSGVGGQTVFTATTLKWIYDNAVTDILTFYEDRYQRQDLSGAQVDAYRKLSDNQIEFSEIIPEGHTVTIRLDGDRFVNPRPPHPFFREYITGETGISVPTTEPFDIGTGKFSIYENGVYLVDSPIVGAPADRYAETSENTFDLGLPADMGDIFQAYHLETPPVYKIAVSGLSGTLLTIPTYTMGNGSLRVYRNGLLMNPSAKGTSVFRYTETSATEITLEVAASSDEVFTFECSAAPTWREDIDGISDATVTFSPSNIFVEGDKKLQIFINGTLMLDSTTLGNAADRYQEDGTNCVLLEVAPETDDVITAIYL